MLFIFDLRNAYSCVQFRICRDSKFKAKARIFIFIFRNYGSELRFCKRTLEFCCNKSKCKI